MRRRGHALGAIATLLVLSASTRAPAHEVGLSRGDYSVEGTSVLAEIAFARKELSSLVAGLDADHDGVLTQAEIDLGRTSIQGAVVRRVKVIGDGTPCLGKLGRAELIEQDGVVLRASYRCAKRPAEARVTLSLIDDLPYGHRHLVRAIQAAGPLDLVLSQRSPTFSFAPPPAPPSADRAAPLREGAVIAATTWTLPVFLLGVIAGSASRRAAGAIAGLFAAASLAGIVASAVFAFTPSPRAVAVAIAVSLVYAGADGLARRAGGSGGGAPVANEDRSRALTVALPFGIAHGLGLAVAFHASGAPRAATGAFALGAAVTIAALSAPLVALSPPFVARPRLATFARASVLIAGLLRLAQAAH